MLTRDELQRYSRHLLLPEVGAPGQERLKASRVLCLGAGGLGSPVALYLAAAGVGRLTIVDFDRVEVSNLQRQVVHDTASVGVNKARSAAERLAALNPAVEVVAVEERFSATNARDLVAGQHLVIDGTDDVATRYLASDACVEAGVPLLSAAIHRFDGQLSLFNAAGGPCYRCLYPRAPAPEAAPSCAEAGVLGVVPGVLGTLQASEALKVLLGVGRPLSGELLLVDLLAAEFRTFPVPKDPACRACGEGAPLARLGEVPEVPPGDDVPEVDAVELSGLLRAGAVELIDVRTDRERAINVIAGARHVPLAELDVRLDELPRGRPLVLHCLAGGRSAEAARRLLAAGFTDVRHLAGGIRAWIRDVDPDLPSY